ncbi:MAG: hypothetical protein ACTSQE_10135 [Candidatus Heimdallarchaeaceae archaeon]
MDKNTAISGDSNSFPIKINNLDERLVKWVNEAEQRIFSIAAGDRIAKIAPAIVKIGFSKILYAANELGVDIDQSSPYILFAPDGTCTYNAERIRRCFTYGCILKAEFDGLMGSHNSMPNGCGYSLFELKEWSDDETLLEYLHGIKQDITEDQAKQLGKGNHFIAVYRVLDSVSGEDTERRFVLLHCSGHEVSKKPLYDPSWLKGEDGYNAVETPHGVVWLFEGDARELYLKEYEKLDKHNSDARLKVMNDLFGESFYELLSSITHQGMSKDGNYHFLGIQKSNNLIPLAFNAEEGGVIINTKDNLSKEFLNKWEDGERVHELGYTDEFTHLNFTPHGGGYEFKYPVKEFVINLNAKGLHNFSVRLKKPTEPSIKLISSYFKPIREYMVYRRKMPIMKEVFRADLGDHIYDLVPLMQLHPKVSIPGGHY